MAETELIATSAAAGDIKVWVNAGVDGHRYKNNGHTILFVENTSGGAHTIRHVEQRACSFGHAVGQQDDSVADDTTAELWVSSNIHRFNDNDGLAHFTIPTTAPATSALRVAVVDYSKA